MNLQQIPLSLYIHIPWCVQKCPYCDFNSHQLKDKPPEQRYVEQLLRDLEQDLPLVWGRSVQTIFIGGGTPSLFSPTMIESILQGVAARIRVKPGAEVTMEANPGTVEHYRLADYVSAGVNRLSLGAQSFATEKLQALGRIHGREEAIAAIEQALSAGFNSVNVDVMFGLPEQTQQQGLDDLKTLIDLKPQHISWYQLTIEPNTLFHHRPPLLPNDDMLWELQTAGQQLLTNHGYHQYEISAYAQPHHPCQHNLNYWQFGDYLGIGAGAHSKITEQQKGEITRSWKIKHPRAYLTTQGSFVGGQRTLCQEERPVEYFMNALRLYQPIKQQQALIHSGMDQQTFNTALNTLIDKAFVTKDDLHFETTEVGKNFLNDALAALT